MIEIFKREGTEYCGYVVYGGIHKVQAFIIEESGRKLKHDVIVAEVIKEDYLGGKPIRLTQLYREELESYPTKK